MKEKINIVIAGASGYVGRSLISELTKKYPRATIIALSRTQQKTDDKNVIWKACDLFSLKSIESALPAEVDLAIYLVHSMSPTAHLDQGTFADYDLILADNFARALIKLNISQLIYLGGIIPEDEKLSLHLQSRLEVEETFKQYNLPTTFLRAGLILGDSGSSFQILIKLVRRLPIMICPKWTQNLTTPIDIQTVVKIISEASLNAHHTNKVYDLAGCKAITYIDMMRETAKKIGKKRYFITVPFFTPTLSRLWVSLITNTSKDLVYPLIESLEHKMVARSEHIFPTLKKNDSYFNLLDKTNLSSHPGRRFFRFQARQLTVRSVQRITLPPNVNAEWVKTQYFKWLPEFLSPLVRVNISGSEISFSILSQKIKLLSMTLNTERSNPDRQLLYITGGILVSKKNTGRLEFRVVLNRRFVLAAIHEYRPALPWFIYIYTQAKLHLLVMKKFNKHVAKVKV